MSEQRVTGMELAAWNTPVCPACYATRDQANPVLNVSWMLSGSGFFTDAATGEKLRPSTGYVSVDRCLVCDWSQVKRESKA